MISVWGRRSEKVAFRRVFREGKVFVINTDKPGNAERERVTVFVKKANRV